jgi:hypothetical protein
MTHIMNYRFFSEFGSGYTLTSLTTEEYYPILGIMHCADSSANAARIRRERAQFYQEEGLNIDANHL